MDTEKTYKYFSFGEENDVKVEFTKYANGQNAILLTSFDHEFGYFEPFMKASVALEIPLLEDDLVYIKNYSGNKGILEFLIVNGFISEPLYEVESGFVSIPVCRILK